jgi:hypothetical protein
MSAIPKRKLCWKCEGGVSLTEENCPFCGVYLSPSNPNENSWLKPPYRLVEEEQAVPPSPFTNSAPSKIEKEVIPSPENEATHDVQNVVITLVLLITGSIFLLFGLILWLFSDNGVFTLHWNSQYWFIYLAIAVPMLLLGWRTLQKI